MRRAHGLLGSAGMWRALKKGQDLLRKPCSLPVSGRIQGASEAQYELGICYWRLGSHDEGRVMLREALEPLQDAT